MTLICFGDSNTWGYDGRSYLGGRYGEGTRWPRLLSSALGAEVRELGENGRCVPHTAAEHSRALAELGRAAPADWQAGGRYKGSKRQRTMHPRERA